MPSALLLELLLLLILLSRYVRAIDWEPLPGAKCQAFCVSGAGCGIEKTKPSNALYACLRLPFCGARARALFGFWTFDVCIEHIQAKLWQSRKSRWVLAASVARILAMHNTEWWWDTRTRLFLIRSTRPRRTQPEISLSIGCIIIGGGLI